MKKSEKEREQVRKMLVHLAKWEEMRRENAVILDELAVEKGLEWTELHRLWCSVEKPDLRRFGTLSKFIQYVELYAEMREGGDVEEEIKHVEESIKKIGGEA